MAAHYPRYTLAHLLDIVSRQRALNFPPGSDYSYTNTGFNLASVIVARVSGQTYPKFTHDEIFVPLEMTSTQWRDDFQRIVPIARLRIRGRAGQRVC